MRAKVCGADAQHGGGDEYGDDDNDDDDDDGGCSYIHDCHIVAKAITLALVLFLSHTTLFFSDLWEEIRR